MNKKMDFGDAIRALKEGKKVAREGWNGKGMYVVLADNIEFHTAADISALQGEPVEVCSCIVMKTANGAFQPGWLASQPDMLSEDWMIVE